ncbi:universal stress protein [Rhizobium jaguaris]|uniref:Universal stress protein n=1 Tax=Rhizobium jaguaris TaxID=1312183 RepID=A0A387FWW6_9HYPH|nr:universal stress protein [Rhizobium jaguaris]AYG63610.1 universal stress protein [Rhizobium jaguaris]
MYKKILIATDGSDHAHKAAEIGAVLAAAYEAEVHLVHVLLSGEIDENLRRMVETEHLDDLYSKASAGLVPGLPATFSSRDSAGNFRILQALGSEILNRASTDVKTRGVRQVSTHLMEGDAAEQIAKVIEEVHPDLVVCGARGLSSLSQLVLGSVSTKVAQLSSVTCVTVR